ncbi:hypothetical protein SPRG_21020 [Saprolegnia parasitica CBS 223.65]|uniref:B box-type domain-containing protein n=1 Tax=Saprolegnia parasitica (strain CBS 223.65) TaxID=695850 RepID=A0A067CA75_SAPPC|nr:hypothetical protein SPRG_21020 [Saprolegnia parasitica CBS 223.65]KDO23456.1 hypothetical protein SPRG_21020 [Saprolegnia parasitica CBS 223.65]|eukprot:XP_012205842.1 hypothetical protein SPRG_21020 [Saprolegnia parasitica CBS 223.65]
MTAARMCVECEDTEAALACSDCGDVYCDLCYQAQHRSGHRQKHRSTPLAVDVPASSTPARPTPSPVSETISPPLASVVVVTDDPMSETSEAPPVARGVATKEAQVLAGRAKYIPMRLSDAERVLFNLLDASLNVSEYTDKVDILSYRSPVKRILTELTDLFNIMSGMMVASDFRNGKKKVLDRAYMDNADFFKAVFEIGRRYKIMNPERMRNNYGKMIYLLQDASMQEVEGYFEFSCIEDTHTVHSFLEARNGLDLLLDADVPVATRSISDTSAHAAVQRQEKAAAIASLCAHYATKDLTADDIKLCLASIDDNNSYLALNCDPISKMQAYLEHYFLTPSGGFALDIRAGRNGARLTHNHKTQFATHTQVSRILSPIVQTVEYIGRMEHDANTAVYIASMGGAEALRQTILCDFFKHGFDGSGADNFFDAGSCIDGRLTSAWNWCSKIEKKPFYHIFLMAGFVGFDGSFEK